MLVKHELYMKKKLANKTNEVLLETLNRTFIVYEMIIEEMQKQFKELKIDLYGVIMSKIFTGHKLLFDILLK